MAKHADDDTGAESLIDAASPADDHGDEDATGGRRGPKAQKANQAARKKASAGHKGKRSRKGDDADEDKPFGKWGTASVASSDGPVPRVVEPSDRAPEGFQRFKVRVENHNDSGTLPTKYVLARKGDRKGAEDAYLKSVGLDARIKRQRDAGYKDVPDPMFVTTELPD